MTEKIYIVDDNGTGEDAVIEVFDDKLSAMRFFDLEIGRCVDLIEADLTEWMKVHGEPSTEELNEWCAPLTADQVIVTPPGQHPGLPGYWWIEPRVPVYRPEYEWIEDTAPFIVNAFNEINDLFETRR